MVLPPRTADAFATALIASVSSASIHPTSHVPLPRCCHPVRSSWSARPTPPSDEACDSLAIRFPHGSFAMLPPRIRHGLGEPRTHRGLSASRVSPPEKRSGRRRPRSNPRPSTLLVGRATSTLGQTQLPASILGADGCRLRSGRGGKPPWPKNASINGQKMPDVHDVTRRRGCWCCHQRPCDLHDDTSEGRQCANPATCVGTNAHTIRVMVIRDS